MSTNYCKSNQCTLYLTHFTHISGNITNINPVWAQTKHLKAPTITIKKALLLLSVQTRIYRPLG